MTLHFLVEFQNTAKKFLLQSSLLVTKDSLLNSKSFYFITTYISVR